MVISALIGDHGKESQNKSHVEFCGAQKEV